MSIDIVQVTIKQMESDISMAIYTLEMRGNPDPRRLALARTNFEQAVLWLKEATRKEQ